MKYYNYIKFIKCSIQTPGDGWWICFQFFVKCRFVNIYNVQIRYEVLKLIFVYMRSQIFMIPATGWISGMNSIRDYTIIHRLSNKFLLINMMSTDKHAHWGRMVHAEEGCEFQLKATAAIKPESSRDNTITTNLCISCTGSYCISSPISFPPS